MGDINKEALQKLRRLRQGEEDPEDLLLDSGQGDPSWFSRFAQSYRSPWLPPIQQAKTGLRYAERAERLLGLPASAALATLPHAAKFIPGPGDIPFRAVSQIPAVSDWFPDMEDVPGAALAFGRAITDGDGIDVDAAIEAYQDELDAGSLFWPAAEAIPSVLLPGGLAHLGTKTMGAAPGIASIASRAAPGPVRQATERGLTTGFTRFGQGLRLPWEAEEAIGRGVIAPFRWAGRRFRPGADELLGPPVLEDPVEMELEVLRNELLKKPIYRHGQAPLPVDLLREAKRKLALMENERVWRDIPGEKARRVVSRLEDLRMEREALENELLKIPKYRHGQAPLPVERLRAVDEAIEAEVARLENQRIWVRKKEAQVSAARELVDRFENSAQALKEAPAPTAATETSGMFELQEMDEIVEIATRRNLGRDIASMPIVKNVMGVINPSAVRNTVEGKGLTGLNILKFEAEQKSGLVMASLGRLGRQERVLGKVDDAGLLTSGNLRGLAPNDVRTNWKQEDVFRRLNDEQKAWLRAAEDIEDAKLAFLKNNGIDIKELDFGTGGHYAGRRLMGKFDGNGNLINWHHVREKGTRIKGKKLAVEEERMFDTQAEGIAEGFRYIPEDEALSMNVRAAYDRVAKQKFADWTIKNSPNISKASKAEIRKARERGDIRLPAGPYFKGYMFGDTEVAKLVQKELDPALASTLLTGPAKVNAVGRFMMLNADISQFLIQLMYMVGTPGGPKAWTKGLGGWFRTFADTRYHSKLIDNNRELLARHPGIITSLRGSEMTEAVQAGGLLDVGPRWVRFITAGPRKLLDPFGRAFNGAMDTAAIQLAKSMDASLRPKTAGQVAQIDAFINEIRGLANTAKLGQSANWRAVESNLLLAPRYNRAIAALLWDTVADGGIRGQLARRTLLRSISGLTAIGVAFSISQYVRETDKKDRSISGMWSAVGRHLDPTSGEFFTWKVGNSNVGPGTKVRSLIKLAGDSYKDPRSLLEISMENPAIRFARGNLAPIGSDAWDIFSGYTYIGDPTGFRDGWDDESVGQDFVKLGSKVILPDIIPIWTQAALLEGGTIPERAVRSFAEFWGGRAYEVRRKQVTEAIAREQGWNYDDLLPGDKARIDRLADEQFGQTYKGPTGPMYKKLDKAREDFLSDAQDITTEFLSAGPGGEGPRGEKYMPRSAKIQFQKAQDELRRRQFGSEWNKEKRRFTGGIYDDLYDMDEAHEEPERGTDEHLLWRYNRIIPEVTDENGEIEWDEYDKRISAFWHSIGEEGVDVVLDNIRLMEDLLPEDMQTFLNARRYAQVVRVVMNGQFVSFWDIEDLPAVRDEIAKDAGATRADVDEYMDETPSGRSALVRDYGAKDIRSAISRSRSTDTGVIGMMKNEFMRRAPVEWMYAMLASGYYMPLGDNIAQVLKDRGEYRAITEQPYDELYRDALARR